MCSSLTTNVFSQQTYQQADLIDKNWYFYSEGNMVIIKSFSNTEIINISDFGQTIKNYYLSDNIETTFDHTKVGNVSSGRYIIVLWNSLPQPDITVYEIVYLDEHTLQLQVVGVRVFGGGITTWKSTKTDWEDPYSGYDNPYDDHDHCYPNCPD